MQVENGGVVRNPHYDSVGRQCAACSDDNAGAETLSEDCESICGLL